MRPSDLKSLRALLGAIRAELASAREVITGFATSIAKHQVEQQQTNKKEWEKTREVLARPRRTDPSEQAGSEANQERRHWQNFSLQVALALGTWLAFAAAAIYAWQAHLQLCEMKRSTDIIRAQGRLEERAWVFVRYIGPKDGCAWKAIDFVNSGHTPALQFSIRAGLAPVQKGQPPDAVESELPGKGIVAPGGTYSSCIGDKSIDSANWSNYDLFIHGRLEYWDVFGVEHWTTFRYKRATNGTFVPYKTGNEMDKNGIDSETN